MSSLRQIAELNTCAIALLQQGEGDRARRTFIEALRRLQALCRTGHPIVTTSSSSSSRIDDGSCSATTTTTTTTYSDVWGSNSSEFSADVSRSQHESLFDLEATQIYCRAFLLVNDIPASATETAAVLLFNTGLGYHLQGVRTGKSAIIQHALEFYQRGMCLLDDQQDDVDHQYVVALVVLMGALCHNMAHCYGWFFQTLPLHSMVDKLSQVVHWMESSSSEEDGQMTEYDELEFFHNALFFAESNDFRYAPAA